MFPRARVCAPASRLKPSVNTLQLISLETWMFFHPGRSHLAGRSLQAPVQGLGLAQGWRNLMGFVSGEFLGPFQEERHLLPGSVLSEGLKMLK